MATTKTILINNTQNGAYWPAGVTFQRTNPTPIDKYSVFSSFDEAQEYALHNAVAYPGQIITVIDGELEYDDWVFEDGNSHEIVFNPTTSKYSIDGIECEEIGQTIDTTKVTVGGVTATRSISKPYDVKSYLIIDTHGRLLLIADNNNVIEVRLKIEAILDEIKGGVVYKGHIDLDAKDDLAADRYYRSNSGELSTWSLSSIFNKYYGNTSETTRISSLNSGWLYCITTKKPYNVLSDDNTGGISFTLENNDYIIIHSHDNDEAGNLIGLSGVIDISALTRENVDIIESLQDDYVRHYQLELSANRLLEQITSNDNDINFLSNEISSTVAVYDGDEKLSNKVTVKRLDNATYNQLVSNNTIDNTTVYIIEDNYIDARGRAIKNVPAPTELSDAANKEYVDALSSVSSEDMSKLCIALSGHIGKLSTDLSGEIELLSTKLSTELSTFVTLHYNVTLSSIENNNGGHSAGEYPDNLLIANHHNGETVDAHDKYYLSFEYGTLVLNKIN